MHIEGAAISRLFGRQTRAYAEYRVFSSLARFSHVARGATVTLTRAERQMVVCVVTVALEDGRRIPIQSRGRHPYDAINRAANRIGDAVRQHTGDAANGAATNASAHGCEVT